jgi:hypothetical protein
MDIRGSCLCGEFRFELKKVIGPFEICHCNRCRKRSGSNGLAMVGVDAEDFQLLSGKGSVSSYEAPVLNGSPSYHSFFCAGCGSPLPPPKPAGKFEIPAGLLDDDPGIRPDKHIYTELAAPWDNLKDDLPRPGIRSLLKERTGKSLPDGYQLRTHHGSSVSI